MVGGLVGQAWGWRALFLLNLPVGLLVVAAAYGLLAPDPPRRKQRFDTPGFFALSGTLLAFSVTLTDIPPLDRGWVKGSIAVLALGLGAVFVRVERRAPMPLLDLGLIRHPAVIATHVAVFCAVLTMAGGMFLSVLYAQLLTDATLATVAVSLAPCAVATFTVALGAGWLSEKVSPRVPVVTGLLVLTMSVMLPALWHPASASALVFWHNLIAGTGLGLATPGALVEAIHGGFAQVFGLAALLAGLGVVAGLLVPRRLGGRADARS